MPGATSPTERHVRRLALAATLVLGLALPAPAAAQDGKTIFGQKCGGCHTIGGGDTVGPDLKGVGERRDRSFVEQFIAAPDKVIASGDPTAKELLAKYKTPMPNLGLTSTEVTALVAFLTAAAAPSPRSTTTATTPQPPARGVAERGKNLFTGADRLAGGGPPCLSCHTIAGIGALGGGALGPDLTRTLTKYGGATGTRSILATLPFPTMVPIFKGRGLTATEQADLLAFLEQASRSERPGSAVGPLLGLGLGGVAVLLVFTLLIWPRRSLNVRRRLVNHSRRS